MAHPRIRLIGFPRHAAALNLAQENEGTPPRFFDWSYDDAAAQVVVYYEQCIREVDPLERIRIRVGMLVEPRELRPWHYEWALERQNDFDLILTHDEQLLAHGHPFYFCPLGGSFIREWGIFPKSSLVSLIPGSKNLTSGHQLRHAVAQALSSRLDVYWPGFGSKAQALRDYHYSVVIENSRSNWWFTEKLIDAFSQGTVPIYWGCPDLGRFFDPHGVIPFQTVDELASILDRIGPEDYAARSPAIQHNLETARSYACFEDWLSLTYPSVFYGPTEQTA